MILKTGMFVFLFLVSIGFAASLGISPAYKNTDFSPGQEITVRFSVLDASPDETYDIYFRGGDLIPYSTLSINQIKGNGVFDLVIRLPEKLDEPGEHTVSVGIKGRPSESSFITTVVEVGSTVKVFVPYPGLYGELTLSIPDGNIGEQIPVELHVINRGVETLNLREVYVDFITMEGKIENTLNYTPVDISFPGDRYFRKYLNTEGMQAGNYVARARVSYSDVIREVNQSFRVGSLFVNITNYTNLIVKDGIQKFYVTLESLWNTPISTVYVDVNLNNTLEQYSFRTPSADLNGWEKKTIESFMDTEKLLGPYNLTLTAVYNGESTSINGEILVVESTQMLVYAAIAVSVIIIIIIIYIIIRRRSKNMGKK